MATSYTFKGIHQISLLETLAAVVPGLNMAETVFFHEGELHFYRFSDGATGELLIPAEDKPELFRRIHKLREQKDPYSWLNKEEGILDRIPGDASHDPDLFSENKNIVLLLRTNNRTDKRKDLFILHFRENQSNFGISRSDKSLSTENKAIIGFMLQQLLDVSRKQIEENNKIYGIFNEQVLNLAEHNRQQKREIDRIKRKYSSLLLDYAVKKLDTLSQAHGITFLFTDEAKAKVMEYKGEEEILDKVLDEAVIFASNVFGDQDASKVYIDDWALNFGKYKTVSSPNERLPEIDPREAKALDLLDKFEIASQKVIEQGQPITSANVGNYCPTPISAPAITDALKKHRKKIILVLQRYPERWPIIRNRFKPLRNLIQSTAENDNLAV